MKAQRHNSGSGGAQVGLWAALEVCLVLAAAALLVIFTQPYEPARALLDPLAKDGSLEIFSFDFYAAARLPALVIGGLMLTLALAGVVWRNTALALLARLRCLMAGFFPRLRQDARLFLRSLMALRFGRGELLLLGAVVLLALAARLPLLMRSPEHDEAYTVAVFASSPVRQIITDYHLPNNHVFHTLLVRLLLTLFGYEPWSVRLPALLAGVLVIPALYLLARHRSGRNAALMAAAGAAAMPVLVYFSTNARGYTIVMLFALLIFLLAEYVRRSANLLAWGLFVLFSALGFYTVPIFLYSFGTALTWLLLACLLGDVETGTTRGYASRWSFLGWFFLTGAATALITMLLYLPIFYFSGIRSVFSEGITMAMNWSDFYDTTLSRMQELSRQWMDGLPPYSGTVLAFGVLFSLIFPLRAPEGKAGRVPWLAAAFLWVVGLLLLQRSNPWARFYTFLIPLILMGAATGWLGFLTMLGRRLASLKLPLPAQALPTLLTTVFLIYTVVGTGVHLANHPQVGFALKGPVPSAVEFIRGQLRDHDLIVVTEPHDAEVWYYARLFEMNMDHFKRELPFFRMYVLVDSAYDQTIELVLDECGPDPTFYDLQQGRVVYQSGTLQVYEFIPFEDLIRKEYHLP